MATKGTTEFGAEKLDSEQADGWSQHLKQKLARRWVRNKLTSHCIESVGQAVSVRSDRRHRQITFGIDTAACRTVVPTMMDNLGADDAGVKRLSPTKHVVTIRIALGAVLVLVVLCGQTLTNDGMKSRTVCLWQAWITGSSLTETTVSTQGEPLVVTCRAVAGTWMFRRTLNACATTCEPNDQCS